MMAQLDDIALDFSPANVNRDQYYVVGEISDPDEDDEPYEVDTSSIHYKGPKLWQFARLYVDGTQIILHIRLNSSAYGQTTVYFKVDDARKNYTSGTPEEYSFRLIAGNTPPTVTMLMDNIVLQNGTTATVRLATVTDVDDKSFEVNVISSEVLDIEGDESSEETAGENALRDIVDGEWFIQGGSALSNYESVIRVTLTAREGRVGRQKITFIVDDMRKNYDRGEPEEHSFIVRVI